MTTTKRIQTRRSISISGAAYDRLKAYAETNNMSKSGVVEKLLRDLFGMEMRKKKTADDKKRMTETQLKGQPRQSAHFTF